MSRRGNVSGYLVLLVPSFMFALAQACFALVAVIIPNFSFTVLRWSVDVLMAVCQWLDAWLRAHRESKTFRTASRARDVLDVDGDYDSLFDGSDSESEPEVASNEFAFKLEGTVLQVSTNEEEIYAPHTPKRPMPPMMRLEDWFRLHPPRCALSSRSGSTSSSRSRPHRSCIAPEPPTPQPSPSLPRASWKFKSMIGNRSTAPRCPPKNARAWSIQFPPRLLPYRSAPSAPPQPSLLQQFLDNLPLPSIEDRDLSLRLHRIWQSHPFAPPPVPVARAQRPMPTQPRWNGQSAPQAFLPPMATGRPMEVCHEPTDYSAPPTGMPPYDAQRHALAMLGSVHDLERYYAALRAAEAAKPKRIRPMRWDTLNKYGRGFAGLVPPTANVFPSSSGVGAMEVDG
uniref:Uncharacterized protein n=1 Tax=Mycena chlorophos TaxID=658473 RepID=A0ABQ0LAG2_MYCCL|nr:predicted protein [Mycena chlorophos]